MARKKQAAARPWSIVPRDNGAIIIMGQPGEVIAHVELGAGDYETSEKAKLVGRMMAKSPELLRRLKWALEKLDDCGKKIDFTVGMARSMDDCQKIIDEVER